MRILRVEMAMRHSLANTGDAVEDHPRDAGRIVGHKEVLLESRYCQQYALTPGKSGYRTSAVPGLHLSSLRVNQELARVRLWIRPIKPGTFIDLPRAPI